MGRKEKNEKKVRADKIYALRQKYEAFIEDDRKRKERNENILSQLDKMRTCNSLVHKYKLKPFADNVAIFQKVSNPTTAIPVGGVAVQQCRCFRTPDQNPQILEQTSLLKKIVSNFILIPKRATERDNAERSSEPQDENIDNTDWKAKYEILNVLKKAEKRGSVPENMYNPHSGQGVNTEHFENRVQSFDIVKNVPEKGIFFDEMIEPSVKIPEDNLKFYPNKVGKDSDDDKTIPLDTSKDAHESEFKSEIGNRKQDDHIKGNEKLVYDDENGLNPAHIYYPHEDIGKPLGDVPTETEDVQYPVEIINVDDFTPSDDVILKEGENINPRIEKTMKNTPDQQPPGSHDTVISTQESPLKQQSSVKPTNDPPVKAIGEADSIDVAPQTSETFAEIVVNEHVDRSDTKDIQEFENEQEMFYQQPDVLENPHPLEQPQEVFTPLAENFSDQQYYYVAPHENPESVHISEHEETSSPYDQNYAQQYLSAQAQEYAEAPDEARTTDNQWEVQAAYEEQGTYEGQEQQYDAQQYVAQQYDEQHEFQRQQQYEGQPYEGQQDAYQQNAIYDNTHLQSAYEPQKEHLQYNQELYPAEGTLETTEQVEYQLDQEEGYTAEHNTLEQKKEVIPE